MEPDSDFGMQDDVGRRAKCTKAFSRSHAAWEKRIQSNDRKVIRFQDHSQELISHTCVKQGAGSIGSYAGQDFKNVALPLSVPPALCEAHQMEMEVGFLWGLFVPGWVFRGFGWFFFSFTGFSCFVSLLSVSNCGGFWG